MQLDEGRQSGVDLVLRAGLQDGEPPPIRSRCFLHVAYDDAPDLNPVGFTSNAITWTWGTSSDSNWSRLGLSSRSKMLKPVRLPPGRARLATRPAATGSPPTKTIGIVEVAPFAAAIPSSRRPPRSRRLCGRRDRRQMRAIDHNDPRPSGIRSSRFVPRHSRLRSVPGGTRPQSKPTGRATCRLRKPITGIAFCCARRARADSNAPPRTRTSSRRLIRSPHRRGQQDRRLRPPTQSVMVLPPRSPLPAAACRHDAEAAPLREHAFFPCLASAMRAKVIPSLSSDSL